MIHVLVLGATGRAGSAALTQLSNRAHTIAAFRTDRDRSRLPRKARPSATTVVEIDSHATLASAVHGVDVIVNAIRLREEIADTALIDLHHRILDATAPDGETPLIVTVGGAGALRTPDGARFWQHPTFPPRTVPRGRAHAQLRDHLEAGQAGDRWAYLVPPPVFDPAGPATGQFRLWTPSDDESAFTRSSISYQDYASALAEAVLTTLTGTTLVGGATSSPEVTKAPGPGHTGP